MTSLERVNLFLTAISHGLIHGLNLGVIPSLLFGQHIASVLCVVTPILIHDLLLPLSGYLCVVKLLVLDLLIAEVQLVLD